jgi:hypothetical protein
MPESASSSPLFPLRTPDPRARIRRSRTRRIPAIPACRPPRDARYGAGWPGRRARSWHAWRTGTPARLAAARMKATAANRAYCQKSSVCHQATSSSRSGSVPPWRAAAPALRSGTSCSPAHGRCTRAGTARVVPPRAAGRLGWLRTSSARPRRRGGTPRRERCCLAGAGARACSPARRCQRRGQARQAGHGGRPQCPREWAASWQAYTDGRTEPLIGALPGGCRVVS